MTFFGGGANHAYTPLKERDFIWPNSLSPSLTSSQPPASIYPTAPPLTLARPCSTICTATNTFMMLGLLAHAQRPVKVQAVMKALPIKVCSKHAAATVRRVSQDFIYLPLIRNQQGAPLFAHRSVIIECHPLPAEICHHRPQAACFDATNVLSLTGREMSVL